MTGSNTAALYVLTGSNSQAATTIGSGVLNINADQALGATAGTLTFGYSGSTLQAGAAGIVLSASRTVVLNSASKFDSNGFDMTAAGTLSGTGSLTKVNAGTLTLAATNSYAGSTTINGGVLATSVNGALPSTSTVAFTGGGTLNVQSTSQTVPGVTVSSSITGTVVGSASGSLTLNANGFSLGNSLSSGTAQLNMAGLPAFVYSGSTSTFTVGGTGSDTNDEYGYLVLASTSTINAATVNVTGQKSISNSYYSTGRIALGQAATINANSFVLGGSQLADTVQFQSGLAANPALTIAGVSGGTSRANLTVGNGNSSNYEPDLATLDLVTGVNGTSQLTAQVGTMIVGTATYGGASDNAKFLMGGGTLDATSIDVAVRPSAGTLDSGVPQTGLFSVNGGAVLVPTFTLGDIITTSGGTVNATATLDGGGLLSVATLQDGNGATGSQAVRTFNWNSGTIANYDPAYGLGGDAAESGLAITIPTMTMAASGTHTFWIDAGQSGAVSSNIGQSGGSAALTKNGGGLLNLSGSNSYGGGTTVSNGTLQLGNASALGTGGLTANAGVLDLNGYSPTVAYLNGSSGTVTNSGTAISGSATLTVNQAIATTFNGTLADGPSPNIVALAKTGSGALYLSGANPYSGGTTIGGSTSLGGGTVLVSAASGGLGSGSIWVGAASGNSALLTNGAVTLANAIQVGPTPSSGTTTIGGNADAVSTLSGSISLAGNVTFSQVANSGSNALNITGGMSSNNTATEVATFAGPGNIVVSNAPISDGSAGNVAVQVTGGLLVLSGTNNYSGGTTVDGGTLILTDSEAIADGTSLTVGNPALFAAPVVPGPVVAGLQTEPSSPIAPVPEPCTLALAAAFFAGAAVYRRMRRR
jgi:autotransporter-associated beta strand protein